MLGMSEDWAIQELYARHVPASVSSKRQLMSVLEELMEEPSDSTGAEAAEIVLQSEYDHAIKRLAALYGITW